MVISTITIVAALVAIIVGGITIVEKVVGYIVGALRACVGVYLSVRDRAVFNHLKKHGGDLYTPVDIAKELNRKPREVLDSLRRLEDHQRAQEVSDDVRGGLWGLHPLEAPPED